MTYKPPRRDVRITFDEDHQYHGAEVALSLDVPVWMLFELEDMANASGQQGQELIRRFGDEVLIEWNLEEEPSGEGLLAQPWAFFMAVFKEWGDAQRVEAPLAKGSPATSGLAQASSPMTARPSGSRRERRAR